MGDPESQKMAVLRIFDAAINRTREGMRVVEDFARFAMEDPFLTQELKSLRHALQSALATLDESHLLAARETLSDVGISLTTPEEFVRTTQGDVVAASWSRLQEALRTLEEYGKLLNPTTSKLIEQLRYQSYTLEKAMAIGERSRARLDAVQLYVLINGRESPAAFRTFTEKLIEAGVEMLQLRDKKLSDRKLVERARILVDATRGTGTLAIINDRPDIASIVHADGIHIGQDELSVKDARKVVGPEALVGVSTHNLEQLKAAILEGADYLGVGPVYESGTKSFEAYAGLDFVREAAKATTLPWFAIGGIHEENLSDVLHSGATRIAVSGVIQKAPDPELVIRALKQMLTSSN